MGQATHLFAFSLNPTHTTNKQRQHTSSPSPQEKLNTTLLCDILNTFKYLNIWCERTYLQLCIIWCFALSLFLSLQQTSLLVSSSNCCFDLLLKNQYLSNSTKISTNTETAMLSFHNAFTWTFQTPLEDLSLNVYLLPNLLCFGHVQGCSMYSFFLFFNGPPLKS